MLDALDEALQWYSKRIPWIARRETERFLTTGSETLVLPDRVLQVLEIGDLTNSRYVRAGSHWRRRAPGPFFDKTGGTVYEWEEIGMTPVVAQPQTDSTLSLSAPVSDSFDVYVRGLARDTVASGTALELYETEETVSINSSETQQTTTLFTRIDSIEKPRGTLADLLVAEDADGRRISRIPTWAAHPLYKAIRFLYIPSANTTLDIEYFRRPDRLTSESQSIDPRIDEEALVWRAAGNLHWTDQEGQAAQRAWGKADEILAISKGAEDQFGERDFHVEPENFYLEREGINDDLG